MEPRVPPPPAPVASGYLGSKTWPWKSLTTLCGHHLTNTCRLSAEQHPSPCPS